MYQGLKVAADARVIYVDMNAFYASIEQQYDPSLRGRPVAVVSHLVGNGTVLASSYEAKALGVVTGVKLRVARQLCRDLAVVETNASLYRGVHFKLRQLLERMFGDEMQMRSVDEAAILLPSNWQGSERALAFAAEIKERVRQELGEFITCSVGIGPNILLAKLATDIRKPDGLFEITLENTSRVLADLPLTALPGIAQANAARLARHGIETPLQLWQAEASDLRAWFGIWGQYWWWRLHGFEGDADQPELQKSLSHEHVLKKWLTDTGEGWPMLAKMTDRLAHRLRRNGQLCRSLYLKVSLVGLPGFSAEVCFDAPVGSYPLLLETARRLYDRLPPTLPVPCRKLTLALGGISRRESGWQADLFAAAAPREAVSGAIERIRSRHGFEAVQLGSSLSLVAARRRELKEQPGFGRIRDARPMG